jgi:alanyl-tRNA synthetase
MSFSANEIRSKFLKFFEKNGHRIVKSSPLVPQNDPTLLFTVAGMVQFKDLFTGKEKRDYTRATTSQKCVRAGGKQNDLENVGFTARHHTFFEMLGNFSFGDYFKTDAINMAWAFITEELKIDKSRLCVTVFKGEGNLPADDEAAAMWEKNCNVPKERIFRLGAKDNFWAAGDTGPCGPCSELHFYQGDLPPNEALKIFDTPAAEDQWIEIWNLVFMQFERLADGSLQNLPKPSIDTGAGLERVAAVANGLKSNYETTLLRPLIDKAAAMCKKNYTSGMSDDDVSMRVLADHARASAFLIADGVFPSNEGRGYVLRRIMRRAIRHGERLGFDDLFFHEITDEVVSQMGEVYPELRESRTAIGKWVKNEEESFRRTLRTGLRLLSQRLEKLEGKVLGGDVAFELYDTYGFPLDLTEVILREKGLTVDHAAFDKALEAQRARAGAFKNDDKGTADVFKALALEHGHTRFLGYDLKETGAGELEANAAIASDTERTPRGLFIKSKIKAIIQDGKSAQQGTGTFDVVLDPTPFYGESGGQVGDKHGELASLSGETLARVKNTLKPVENFHVTEVQATAPLKVGDIVLSRYDAKLRRETRAHHSATHLVHKALHDVLGDHVKQAGSLVTPDRFRFDFSHFEALTADQLDAIERHVSERINKKAPVQTDVLGYEDAKKAGAVALFGEKYGDKVRVLTMADSKELCGGTHAFNTGDISAFRITKEEAIAAGVRRVEGVVSEAAHKLDDQRNKMFTSLAAIAKGTPSQDSEEEKWWSGLVDKVGAARKQLGETGSFSADAGDGKVPAELHRALLRLLGNLRTSKAATRPELLKQAAGSLPLVVGLVKWLDEYDRLDKRLSEGKSQELGETAKLVVGKARDVKGTKLVAEVIEGVSSKDLRNYADRVRDLLGSGVVALGVVADGKASVIVAVSKDLTSKYKAGDLVKVLAAAIGGSGGGKPDLAQAGGANVDALPKALADLATSL